jgi:single-stranded-DNA-specific exonuclease
MPSPDSQQTKKRWITASAITPEANNALKANAPVVRQLLFNRNILNATDADTFLGARPPDNDDPLQLAGLGEAVERIEHAIAKHEPIAIYGDYDTDGVTSAALLVQVLQALGAYVREYIPNRFDEGYGLNIAALDTLKADGRGLVVTVDCGIRSMAEAEHARAIGLDMIITDHHTVGDELPDAFAVVNPKRLDDQYPYRDFAGVGIAYKIAQALVRRRVPQPINGGEVLDLVALGTVSDLAPLTGENRALVRKGLGVINKAKREGLKSLLRIAHLRPGSIDAGNIGFALGPRLNAAGRLDSALASYELLTTNDIFRAEQLATQLEQQNRERQELTKQMTRHARQLALEAESGSALLFAAHDSFNPGVVGLAAARLMDEFYRPVVVASIGESETRGSARSIKEFHITEALDKHAHLLVRHGGHAAAAGFTATNANVNELADGLRHYAFEKLDGEDLRPTLRVDAAIELKDVTFELAQLLKLFEPCGYGNPAPVFAMYGVEPKYPKALGSDGSHMRLAFSDGWRNVDAVAFKQAHHINNMPKRVDVVFGLEINEWRGEYRLQMNVKDMRESLV